MFKLLFGPLSADVLPLPRRNPSGRGISDVLGAVAPLAHLVQKFPVAHDFLLSFNLPIGDRYATVVRSQVAINCAPTTDAPPLRPQFSR
ncbi:hypothetical protein D3C86_1643230 [compost metagenome]